MHSAFFMPKSTLFRVLFVTWNGKGDSDVKRSKLCFSKKLMIADYVTLAVMVAALFALIILDRDATEWAVATAAWIAQVGISTGAYYWKAKGENLVKLPMQLLQELPDDMRERADPNSIIASVMGIGTSNNN